MSLDVITGKHLEELMLRIQDGVKQEERASFCEECDTFHLVFIAGVAGGLAEAGCRIEHEAVVDANRFPWLRSPEEWLYGRRRTR